MQPYRVGAELEHLAEHGNLPGAAAGHPDRLQRTPQR
jgi:hypothetical protein